MGAEIFAGEEGLEVTEEIVGTHGTTGMKGEVGIEGTMEKEEMVGMEGIVAIEGQKGFARSEQFSSNSSSFDDVSGVDSGEMKRSGKRILSFSEGDVESVESSVKL